MDFQRYYDGVGLIVENKINNSFSTCPLCGEMKVDWEIVFDFKGDLIDDEKWKERIYDFISHDLKKTYDYYLCEAQRKKLLIAGRTNKGIYFALRYFYEIKHGDWARSHNSIGIVEYIYDEACDYWCAQELNHRGVVQAIEKQIEQQEQQSKRFVKRKKNREKNDFEEL